MENKIDACKTSGELSCIECLCPRQQFSENCNSLHSHFLRTDAGPYGMGNSHGQRFYGDGQQLLTDRH